MSTHMRPHGSPKELERRRYKAVTLLRDGHSVNHVARRVAATPKSVRQWWREYTYNGAEGLKAKPARGRPSKLTVRQKRGLRQRLMRGARSQGFATDLWTGRRVQQLIDRCYGVEYHHCHVDWMLQQLGFSPSKARASRRRAR